jgi:rfaE bifunctional protein kinase chain/domain
MKQLENIRILVVGDIMLDRYVVGDVERISPEAPVPVVHVKEEYHTLGGCGNVVRNLRSIGCKVDCLASVGIDIEGEIIVDELKDIDARSLIFRGSKRTTVKERIIADQRKVQMLRIDREDTSDLNEKLSIETFNIYCRDVYDIIIVSDYAKGMITNDLMETLKSKQNASIIVDPKPNHINMYNDVFMITPNEKEWKQMMLSSPYTLNNVPFILQTLGNKGMNLIDNQRNEKFYIPAEPVEIFNVSGAGDTVVSVMAVCLSLEMSILRSAQIANKCAGYVVTKPGTTVVPKHIFDQAVMCVSEVGE